MQIQDDWSNFISVKLNINILIRGEREKEKLPITWERLKKTQQDIINFLIRDATRKIINGERKEENRKIEHGIKCLEIKLQRNILRFLRKKRRVLKVSGNKQRKKRREILSGLYRRWKERREESRRKRQKFP